MKCDDIEIDVRGRRLFARDWRPENANDLAPIILMHDSLGCVELWRDFPQTLCAATGRRVVAYDRLGFGRSDNYPGPISLDFVVTEARLFLPFVLEAAGVDSFVLFGHSVGGDMSVVAAAEFPTRCRALITESAQAFAEDITLEGVRRARTTFADPAAMERLKRYHGDKAPWVVSSWIDSWLSPAFANWSLEPWLTRLTCPVLALHGDNDEYGSRRHPDMIVAMAGGPATLGLIQDCGHVPHREKQGIVRDLVAQFLENSP
jgi:pimeloyl-ACP methyl ester carboxylesterase